VYIPKRSVCVPVPASKDGPRMIKSKSRRYMVKWLLIMSYGALFGQQARKVKGVVRAPIAGHEAYRCWHFPGRHLQ